MTLLARDSRYAFGQRINTRGVSGIAHAIHNANVISADRSQIYRPTGRVVKIKMMNARPSLAAALDVD